MDRVPVRQWALPAGRCAFHVDFIVPHTWCAISLNEFQVLAAHHFDRPSARPRLQAGPPAVSKFLTRAPARPESSVNASNSSRRPIRPP